MIHYLPGCDVQKNHPKAILKMKNYMKTKEIIIEPCCRVKNKFLKSGDTIINNCTLCNLILTETHPDNQCFSLYEYVLKDKNFPWVNHQGKEMTVQDCWRTRDNFTLQSAVRQCLDNMNITIIETKENYNKTRFCGVWLNNAPTKDCVEVAPNTFHDIMKNNTHILPFEEQAKRMKKWVYQYKTEQILVYCNGCEKGIKLGEGQPVHMIELLAEGFH